MLRRGILRVSWLGSNAESLENGISEANTRYEYERLSLDIPRKLHDKVKPFLKQNLDMDVSIKGSYLIITLTPAKTTKSTTATTDIPLIRLG